MTFSKRITTTLISCAAGVLSAGISQAAEPTYCVAVGGGFGSGGTTFIGRGFAVPAAGNCVPWSGFTKTASSAILMTSGAGCLSSNGKVLMLSLISTDPSFIGSGQTATDSISLCPKGVTGCPTGADFDEGTFGGHAAPETCTTALLNLPATHN